MEGIFSGIKVLDLTRVIAGPLCTQMLSDAGATVYKVERLGQGDDTRSMGPFLDGRRGDINASSVFISYNRGKKSLTIDISTPEGAELIRQLAAQCDVVVENFKAGNLAKYGLDYDSIKKINPTVIYCSISGFGQAGPYSSFVAYDFILQGLAGMMSTCGHADGEPGGEPMRTAIPITDVVAGLTAHIAIIGALFHRFRKGEGQYIDASLLDSSVALNGHLAVSYLASGNEPPRMGNRNPIAAPSEVFACTDGHLIIAAGNDRQFGALCEEIGLKELRHDELFSTNALRVLNREALKETLREKIENRNRDELLANLRQAGVPSGPINSMADVFADPQVKYKDLTVDVDYGDFGPTQLLRSPLRFSKTPVQHLAPPLLGEHTTDVLKNELGLSDNQLQKLRQLKAIA